MKKMQIIEAMRDQTELTKEQAKVKVDSARQRVAIIFLVPIYFEMIYGKSNTNLVQEFTENCSITC